MTIEGIISDLDKKLTALRAKHKGLDLRDKVLHLVEILKSTRKLNVAVLRASGIDSGAARERIRLYIIRYVGIPLDAVELEVVGGISEYGRRIRELRVEDGYKIISGPKEDEESGLSLKSKQYLLIRPDADLTAARRWRIANRIRKEPGGTQTRILKYFQENVGQILTTEELAYVAKTNSFQRRVRELRTEEGYAIATQFTGRPDLKQGEYVLEDLERVAEPHDRHISREVEKEVYERDNYRCINCNWHRDVWTKDDPRHLALHHIEHHASKGSNEASNLVVICNRCHNDIHAGRLILTPRLNI